MGGGEIPPGGSEIFEGMGVRFNRESVKEGAGEEGADIFHLREILFAGRHEGVEGAEAGRQIACGGAAA